MFVTSGRGKEGDGPDWVGYGARPEELFTLWFGVAPEDAQPQPPGDSAPGKLQTRWAPLSLAEAHEVGAWGGCTSPLGSQAMAATCPPPPPPWDIAYEQKAFPVCSGPCCLPQFPRESLMNVFPTKQ